MPLTPILYGFLWLKGLDLLLARSSDVQVFAAEWGGLAVAQIVDFELVSLEHLIGGPPCEPDDGKIPADRRMMTML
eukprot:Skav201873  [mRNA]  locus=scaffold793:88152:88735:- [translate_table: standard]